MIVPCSTVGAHANVEHFSSIPPKVNIMSRDVGSIVDGYVYYLWREIESSVGHGYLELMWRAMEAQLRLAIQSSRL